MGNIICTINNNLPITSNNIISFNLENNSNNKLEVNITVSKLLYNQIINNTSHCDECKIFINNKKYFDGIIKSLQIENNYINITAMHDNTKANQQDIENNNRDDILINKFKLDNKMLFQNRNNYNNNNLILNINDIIINNSLKINIDKSLPISELNLSVSASWNKLCIGYCDLTNKINNKLRDGLINTFTPNKLIKSWPKIFDRVIANNRVVLKTKYFITHSKLEEYNTDTVNLDINNKQTVINKTAFKYNLSIGWEYSQFTTENIHCKIINNIIKSNNKQVLNINLHNVQEYIEDIYSDSFFKSKLGNSILNIIICEVKQFIINSMQNITITFQVPMDRFSEELNINNLIKINNYTVVIKKIELSFIQNKYIATITAIGSEYDKAFTNANTQNISINNTNDSNDNNDNINDVLESISIINTADEQLTKINDVQDIKEINDILNENPTKLIITLKPIKTEYNKIENINLGNMNLL